MNFNEILDATNKVAKGVRWKTSTQNYLLKRLIWVSRTAELIENGNYKTKGYTQFTIHERGKLRHIRACHISDRAVQKAFNQTVLKPKIYPRLIYDNGASQTGKGTDFAIRRLKTHLSKFYRKHGNNGYALVLDFSNYFGNINKNILREKLSRYLSKEEMDFMEVFLNDGGEGLGLGSEVNQTCAIFYANDLDHFIKEKLCIKYYARYMDDSYLIHQDRAYLEECFKQIKEICARDEIKLNTGKCKIINLKTDNLNYLKKQFRLTDTGKIIVRPIRANYVRRRKALKSQAKLLDKGVMNIENFNNSYQSWRGFITKYNAPYHLIRELDLLHKAIRVERETMNSLEDRVFKAIKANFDQAYERTNEVSEYYEEQLKERDTIIDELLIAVLEG